jgi:hypothetical protein
MMRPSPHDAWSTATHGTSADTVAVLPTAATPGVDNEAPARHLAFLDVTQPRLGVQVAPDVPGAPQRINHGSPQSVIWHLIRANEAGAGICVMGSAGGLRGHNRESVRRVRFVIVDLDSVPVPDGLDAHGLIWLSPWKAHTLFGDESVTDPLLGLRRAGHADKYAVQPKLFRYVQEDVLHLRARLIEG